MWFKEDLIWDYREDPNGMVAGSQVHLFRDKQVGYVFIYLSPDERKKDRLDLVVPLEEIISPRTKSDQIGRWDLMDRLGRTMHFSVHLSGTQQEAVRRRRQSLKARQKAA